MSLNLYPDEYFMKEALKEAQKAFDKDEIPVGAVVVCNQQIIARAYNSTETLNDVTAHAEMLAFTAAANYLGGKYLQDCILFVTLEPCVMCAGASYWTQISKVVYGTQDDKRGFLQVDRKILHPTTIVSGGIMENECRKILLDFFESKRK